MTPLRVGLLGASGRMGAAVQRAADERGDTIVRPLERGAAAHELDAIDVIVDFTSPAGFSAAVALARVARVPLVSGTTGLDAVDLRQLDELAQSVPALHAPNMSIGVAVLARIVQVALAALPAGFDVEIVETHHRRKKDAPSGTALALVEAARAGREQALREVRGRDGLANPREPDEIGVHAVRGGDVVGDHTVHLLGDGERLELTHRATDRLLFGRGALVAAHWLRGKPAGRYSMADVVAGTGV